MTWRTVLVHKQAKLSYKNDYLIVRGEDTKQIHLSELSTVIVESTAVTITSFLISELLKRKVKLIFCDELRNPVGEFIPYYGSHDSSKRLKLQISWSEEMKKQVWTEVIRQKLINQKKVLEKFELTGVDKLTTYIENLTLYDVTNREGHAAKVYFTRLFGRDFTRTEDSSINASLNYGYSLLLSTFNREICKKGYATQLGLKHTNQFNHFNLSSDLMEPFRCLVEEIVYVHQKEPFGLMMKRELLEIFNKQIMINGKNYYLNDAVQLYVSKIFKGIEKEDIHCLLSYENQ